MAAVAIMGREEMPLMAVEEAMTVMEGTGPGRNLHLSITRKVILVLAEVEAVMEEMEGLEDLER